VHDVLTEVVFARQKAQYDKYDTEPRGYQRRQAAMFRILHRKSQSADRDEERAA